MAFCVISSIKMWPQPEYLIGSNDRCLKKTPPVGWWEEITVVE